MQIFESSWLINMLEKSSNKPDARILNIFDIISDWLQSPGIQEQSHQFQISPEPPENLKNYLYGQAKLAEIDLPEILVHQIYFMLIAAIQEAIIESSFDGFKSAKLAANALVLAQSNTKASPQTKQDLPKAIASKVYAKASKSPSPLHYGIAATVMMCVLAYALIQTEAISLGKITTLANASTPPADKAPSTIKTTNTEPPASQSVVVVKARPTNLSPLQVSTLLTKIEKMRSGNCYFPEALQIPDQHKSAYINITVGGQAPKNYQELEIANMYLKKVRCNYTPMLMQNSTN